MINFLFFLFIFSFVFFVSGCSQFSDPQPTTPKVTGNNTQPKKPAASDNTQKLEASFESIKSNIIEPKCFPCHQQGGRAKGIPFEKETDVTQSKFKGGDLIVPGKASESVFYRVMSRDPSIRGELEAMPPEKAVASGTYKNVTEEEIQVVAAWINGVADPSKEIPDPAISQSPDLSPSPIPSTPPSETIPPAVSTPSPTDAVVNTPAEENKPDQNKPDNNVEIINFDYLKKNILDSKCLVCHNSESGNGGSDYVFDSREKLLALKTDDGFPFLNPEKPEESALYLSLLVKKEQRIGTIDDKNISIRKMPPAKSVSSQKVKDITMEEMSLIEAWIKNGAQ